jgi:hypothetical protein
MNNQNSSGYFLLEVVIYCAIATFLCWLTITHSLSRISFLSSSNYKTTRLSSIHLASTLFMRTINQLPAQRTAWKKVSEKSLIASTSQGDLGLLIEDHKLWKITGTYNVQKDQWYKKNKTMIIDCIQQGQFQVTMNTKTPQYIKAVLLHAKIKVADNRTHQLEQWAVPKLMELS